MATAAAVHAHAASAPLTPRTTAEKIFIWLFVPTTVIFYLIYKYPLWFVPQEAVERTFYWFGKSTGFWYSTVYSATVCGISR